MKLLVFPLLFLVLLSACKRENRTQRWDYPKTKTQEHSDEYFGVKVSDPYRWLENDTSAEVASWVSDQNRVTQSYLEELPDRDLIRQRLKDLWNYERYSAPKKEGDYYFFTKNDGLQNQSIWYRQKSLNQEAEIFLDPNSFSADGTISLSGASFSKDGKYFAYSTSTSGSDWRNIYVMDVAKKIQLPDTIRWAKFTGISWAKNGFYYSTYDKPEEGQELSSFNYQHKVYFHKLGTLQSEDKLVFGGKEQAVRYASAQVSEDQKYLIISAAERTNGNAVFLKSLEKENAALYPLVESYEDNFDYETSIEGHLIFKTDFNAPNGRLIKINPKKPKPSNWEEFIPEGSHVLSSVNTGGSKLFLTYLQDASSHVYQYSLKGELEKEIELPALGTAYGFEGKKGDTEIFFSFTSFTYPLTSYKYDIASGEISIFRRPEVDFDPEAYETRQVFYESKDGTKVPMFIVMKKGLSLDGTNATYLYGYGGFNISLRPSFSISRMVWLEQGGIFAMPNLRGGGEYGNKWHHAGTKMQKQNVFDDFIAAAEYLIAEEYTNKEKLAIFGGSNGGLLVGACMTQRPDLFQVAVPAVGVLDMLRYHKFTAGAGWIFDYGCADSSQAMFEYLKGYSPVHNVVAGTEYPATLVKTADHDDRVVPAHSFKFISELQSKQSGENPVLIRIDSKAGHGAGKPTSKILDEWADTYAFVYANMGQKFWYDPNKENTVEPKYN